MGMFDTMRCAIPLEHELLDGRDTTIIDFQTKDLDRRMSCLQINKEGRLVEHKSYREGEWPQTIKYRSVDLSYEGKVAFYTLTGNATDDTSRWIEFKAEFRGGQLQKITSVCLEKIKYTDPIEMWTKKDCNRNFPYKGAE